MDGVNKETAGLGMPRHALLEVCIPVYKRTQGSLRAAESVLTEIERSSLWDRACVRLVDDHSENGTYEELEDRFKDRRGVTVQARPSNLGMSRNIKTMLEESTADYSLILTDDDWLEEGAIRKVISAIDGLYSGGSVPSLIFPPRHSYLEDGTLYCVDCDPYPTTRPLRPSVVTAARHCANGFILSGLVLRNEHIDFRAWDLHVENAYFPVIVTAGVLCRHTCLFLKERIVHHTVLNVCHWEAWGSTQLEQSIRLHLDFLSAVDASSSYYEKDPVRRSAFTLLSLSVRGLWISMFAGEFIETDPAKRRRIQSAAESIRRRYHESAADRFAFAGVVAGTAAQALKYALLSAVPTRKRRPRWERAARSAALLRSLWSFRPARISNPGGR